MGVMSFDGIYGYTRVGKIIAGLVTVLGYASEVLIVAAICYGYYKQEGFHNFWLPVLFSLIIIKVYQYIGILVFMLWRLLFKLVWFGCSEEEAYLTVQARKEARQERRQERREMRQARRLMRKAERMNKGAEEDKKDDLAEETDPYISYLLTRTSGKYSGVNRSY